MGSEKNSCTYKKNPYKFMHILYIALFDDIS